jgi:non-ribosomal peptide synthetase component F
MFVLQNAPMPVLEMADLTLSALDIHNGTSKFDLTLSMNDTEQGLIGVWEYNTDLFAPTTITQMAGHFQILLEEIVASPQERVLHLPILSADERHQLLMERNQTQTNYPQDVCIHQLFEATVERSPAKVAVVFENQQLTYSELNQRANQLAGYLKKCGIGTENFVGFV